MARLTLAGGKLDEYGDKLPFGRLFNGEVIEGLRVSPTSTASTSVQVAPGSGFFRTGAVPGNWVYPFVLDTTGGLTVAAPTAQSQPMLVDVVAALDLTAISTTSTNNPNSWALYAVGGTPNASPVRPSNAQIQSAVGSSKPYIKLGWFQHDSTTASSGITVVNDARLLVRPYVEGSAGTLVADGSGNVSIGTKAVDSNGWTVYNYGGWKMWTRQFTFGSGGSFTSGAIQLPVGVAKIGDVAPSISYQANETWASDRNWDQYWSIIPSGASQNATTFSINRTSNGSSGASVITLTFISR